MSDDPVRSRQTPAPAISDCLSRDVPCDHELDESDPDPEAQDVPSDHTLPES